jgi:AcrR family transcriptional regulator
MREIAQTAGVPIASLYQYYPDQTALLRALAVEFYGRIRERLVAALTFVERGEDVPAFIDAMIDGLLMELGRRESHLNVWAACQSHPVLRELDMNDALELAALLSARFETIAPGVDPDAVRDICAFAVVMAGPAVRQSFVMPKREGERMIRELKTLIRLRAEGLLSAPRVPGKRGI